jgi:hypothetical protein
MRCLRPALLISSKPSTSKLSTSNLLTLVLCILILSTLSFAAAPDRITGPIASSQLMRLSEGVPMRARPQYDQGRVDPALKLGYMTLLTVPSASQQKAITQLQAQQQDPHSPQYHHWLTPDQYADRFGLSPNDVQKLTAWLQSQGFTVVRIARARNFIVFSGTAAQAETAFQTQIHNFDIDGEKRFSNVVPPSIPAKLTGIVTGIRGLSNFPLKSHALRSQPNYTAPGTSLTGFWIAPGDVTTMYDLQKLYTAGITGAGYTLAVMGETDVYLADLNDFRTIFGLPQISGCTFFTGTNVIQTCDTTNFQYVVVTGNTDPGSPNSIQDDLTEADIDLEYSNAVAQEAQIIYVNAPDPNGNGVTDAWYFAIDQNISPVITLSYGLCELFEANNGAFASDESELSLANTLGITFMNSSGDFGATECEPNAFGDPNATLATLGLAVSYPASSQYVTGVGGTMIPSTEYTSAYWSASNGPTGGSVVKYIPEQGWNDDQEWGLYCVANPTNGFCTENGITSWQTAQASLAITAGGGGASNCTTINNETGVCVSGSPQPSYQQSLKVPGQTTAVRFSPDVSLLASVFWPGFIICTPESELPGLTSTTSICANGLTGAGGFFSFGFTFGGTSIATPMFAGIVTLLNQDVVQNGLQTKPGLGNINPTLYKLAATPANGAFNLLASSTSTGSNSVYCEPGTPGAPNGLPEFPAALVCPAAVAPATEGFFGFDASNFDPTTNYNLVTGLGSVDAYNLATSWLAAATAATTTAVVSSQNPSNFGTAVTFTATVTTVGKNAPTGTVTFYNGGTSLGTGTLVNLNATQATATFTTLASSPLPPGTDSITAAYGGDTNNSASTSAILSQTVNPPTFTFSNTGAASHTTLAGQTTLAYTFLTTPTSGTTFAGTVTFGCTFAPPDPTLTNTSCAFTPASIAAGGSSPAGTPVTMTITTAGPNTGTGSQFRRRADNRSPWLPLALPLAGIVMVGFAGRKMSKLSVIACLFISLALLGLMVACGGSSSPPPIAVSVSPGATVFPNNTGWPSQTTTFTATVTNGTNTAVNWTLTSSVLCTTASNPCGSLSSATGSPTTYTAPTIAAGLPASVTVTATSQVDPTKSGQAIETIAPATVPGTYAVTVTATEATVTVPATPAPALVVQ